MEGDRETGREKRRERQADSRHPAWKRPNETHRRLPEVDEHEVVVRAAADQLVAVSCELFRQRR